MKITTMTEMWNLLDVYTLTPEGAERTVNPNNEWGGYSRKLEMPVFTAWFDMVKYDKETKKTTALVCDTAWLGRPIGLPNQERWVDYSEKECDGQAAFFIIHAVEAINDTRKIKEIDGDRVFVGSIRREGGKTYIDGVPQKL